jgi:Protein of unknown function (DUF2490)
MIKYLGAIGLAMGCACPATAENDVQQWLTIVADVKLGDKDSLSGNFILRSRPDSWDWSQRFLRVGYTRKLDKGQSVGISYANVRGFVDNGPDRFEHRFTQTYGFALGALAGGKVDARVQAEQSIVERYSDVGLRARGRVRWVHSLDQKKIFEAQLSEEPIFALNDTDYGQRSGLVANRLGAALHVAMTKTVGFAPSYTWQLVNRRGAPNRNDHVLGLTLDAHF